LILLVETNFILELAFLQEGHEHCEAMIELAWQRADEELELAIPVFSVGEAYHRQIGQENARRALQERIIAELEKLSRSRPYAERTAELQTLTSFLEESGREDRRRLETILKTLLSVVTVIPLTADIVAEAFDLQRSRGLSPPDALVYSSVLSHLRSSTPRRAPSCFVTRDSDFTDDDISGDLESLGCKILFTFEDGLGYARSHLL
jgi:predicted nucleic acid-binding protein